MPRAIDHLVLAVPDLAAAVGRYRAMGFTVGSRNRHPWGTVNAVVELHGAYLELIGLDEDFRAPPPDDPAAPFAGPVAAAVARGGGLTMVALRSDDAESDAGRFAAQGFGTGQRLDFSRSVEDPDGWRRDLRFELAFSENPELPDAGLFTCRHRQRFGNPAARRHANRAWMIDAVVLAADTPGRHLPFFRSIVGAEPEERPGGFTFPGVTGRLDLLSPGATADRYGAHPAPGRFAAFGIIVDALAPLRALLDRVGLPRAEIAGALVVPPEAAFGVALAFAPAPCHSRP